MRCLIIVLCLGVLYSCKHPPYFTKKKFRKIGKSHSFSGSKDVNVCSFHFSAAQRKPYFYEVDDTLVVEIDIENMLESALMNHSFSVGTLQNDSSLLALIQPKIRWKRRALLRFLERQDYKETVLLPILCYDVSFGPEKSAGGGLEFVHNTGNDRYNIAQELYIAIYERGELVFLNNAIRWDQKIVPAGTPITHEFPQEVLDTLIHMALEPLLKQMEGKPSNRGRK